MEDILPTPEQEAEADAVISPAQKKASQSREDFLMQETDPKEMIELLKNSDLRLEEISRSVYTITGKIKGHDVVVQRNIQECRGSIDGILLDHFEAQDIAEKYLSVAQRQEKEREVTEKSIKLRDEVMADSDKKASALADIL